MSSNRTIHHATVKSAIKAGVAFIDETTHYRLANIETQEISVETWTDCKLAIEDAKAGDVTWQKVKKAYCGVMRFSYHDRYEHNPHGPGCGDGLDVAMRDAFTDPESEKLDEDALKQWGEALDLWNPAWDSLNVGMRRMNLANRVRALLRNNEGSIELQGKLSRFGVAYEPSKRKAKRAA